MKYCYSVYAEKSTYEVFITKDKVDPEDSSKIILEEGVTVHRAEWWKGFYEASYKIHGDFISYV